MSHRPLHLAIALVTFQGLLACGNRKREDLAYKDKQNTTENKSDSLVIAGNGNSADATAVSDNCSAELQKSSHFNPGQAEAAVTLVFSAKLKPDCFKRGVAQVHLFSEGQLTLPGALCRPQEGPFNLLCTGSIVTESEDGTVQLKLDASDPAAQLETLRVKVSYGSGE